MNSTAAIEIPDITGAVNPEKIKQLLKYFLEMVEYYRFLTGKPIKLKNSIFY